MKKRFRMIVWCAVAIILSGCGRSVSSELDWSSNKTDPERFVWGSNEDLTVSLGEMGLFYVKDEKIQFYDLETKQEYVLCSKANCMHNSSKCPAYFARDMFGKSVDNIAQIDGYVYCTYLNAIFDDTQSKSPNEVQLLRIDPSTGSRKVVAAFQASYAAGVDREAFYATSIMGGNVQYCNGYAWFRLIMLRPGTEDVESVQFEQLCGVNLETGEVVSLNEYDDASYSFEAVCANTVYYKARWDTEPLLTEAEFYEHRNEDGTITIDGKVFNEYSDYYFWHSENIPDEYKLYAYDIATGKTQVIFEGTTIRFEGGWQSVPYCINGEYNGKTLYKEYLPDETGRYTDNYHGGLYLLDRTDFSKELLVELKGGDCLWIAQGYDRNFVFPDGTFFYAENMNDKTAEIYVYDLNTGTSTYLFTDDASITFRIFGEYNGGFFGKHKDHQDDMRFYWISKEDFYAGNLDAAIMYQL